MPKAAQAPVEEQVITYDPYEYVDIMVPRDYKGDERNFYVNVNDHNFLLPRGKVASVPRYIAEVIQRSIEQDERTLDLIEATAQKD